LNSLLRRAKVDFLGDRYRKAEGNPGKTWKVIKSVINPVDHDDIFIVDDDQNINQSAEQICDHFSSIGGRSASSVAQYPSDGSSH